MATGKARNAPEMGVALGISGKTRRYETQAVDVKTPRHPKMRGA